jgi:uncharacterized membrane protein YgdD (TMEM256/DUF423 family)
MIREKMMCPCQKVFFTSGALFGLLAFAAGAFGSHILKNKLSPDYLTVFEVAVRYQMYHALALMVLAWATLFFSSSLIPLAGWFFVFGTVIFCGSLYILVFSGVRWWGAITPVGGIILLLGWLLLVMGGLLSKTV